MKERRKYGGIKRAVRLPKLVRVAVIRASRAYCALNRSVPFAPILPIYIYTNIYTNLINGNFFKRVLENTDSFSRIKLFFFHGIDHVSLRYVALGTLSCAFSIQDIFRRCWNSVSGVYAYLARCRKLYW